MRGFCPRCGGDAEVVEVHEMPGMSVMREDRMRVTRCLGCGTRTSWYSDGKVTIWKAGAVFGDVPEGVLIVSPGDEKA